MIYNIIQKHRLKKEAYKILSSREIEYALSDLVLESMSNLQTSILSLETYRQDKTHSPSDTMSSRRERVIKKAIKLLYWLNIYLERQDKREEVEDRLFNKLLSNVKNIDTDMENRIISQASSNL